MQAARVRFKHSWGTAEKLYKSEAIDSFGNKYLLGVYETVKEAEKAFDEWNKEHPGRKYPVLMLLIARICRYMLRIEDRALKMDSCCLARGVRQFVGSKKPARAGFVIVSWRR